MLKRTLIVFGATVLVAGCGGGNNAVNPTLSGIAAVGAPLADAPISLACGNGATKATVANAKGEYSFTDLSGCTAPYVVKAVGSVSGTAEPFVSVLAEPVVGAATLNVTPLTHAIAATLSSNGDPLKLAADIVNEKSRITSDAVTQRSTALKTSMSGLLSSAGVPANFDLLKTPFSADRTGFDKVLDNLKVDVKSSEVVITNVGGFVSDDLKSTTTAPQSDSSGASIKISKETNFSAPIETLPVTALDKSIADSLQEALNRCFSVPAADRGTLVAPADACKGIKIANNYLHDGATGENAIGVKLTSPFYDNAKFAKPEVIRYLSNTANDKRALVLIPVLRADAIQERLFTVLENSVATGNVWAMSGNQRPFLFSVAGFVQKITQLATRGQLPTQAASTFYMSGISFYFDYKVGQAAQKINYVKVTGPSLPAGGVFLRKAPGCDQYFTLWADAATNPNNCASFYYLTSRAATVNDTDNVGGLFGVRPNYTSQKISDDDIKKIGPDQVYTFEVVGSTTGCPGGCPNYTFYERLRSRPYTMGQVASQSGEVDKVQWNDEIQPETLAAIMPASGTTPGNVASLKVSYVRNLDAAPPFKALAQSRASEGATIQSDSRFLPISPNYVKGTVINSVLENGGAGWPNPQAITNTPNTYNFIEILGNDRFQTAIDRIWRY